MARSASDQLVLTSLSGGMNNTDNPHQLPDNQCVEAKNVEFYFSSLGERRLGCEQIDLTNSQLDSEGVIVHLSTHLPKFVELVDSELWAVGSTLDITASVAHRVDGSWEPVDPKDEISAVTPDVLRIASASIHGKWFVAYKSAVDRLHVWDGVSLRRVGLKQPDQPGWASLGFSPTHFPATYRVRFIVEDGNGKIILRSEPSEDLGPLLSPGPGIRITIPPLINEGETHWEIEESSGDGNFYIIATLPITTTTFDDFIPDIATLAEGVLSEEVGNYTVVPSVKFIVADEDRLIFGGSWEDPEKDSRLSWTPVWASTGVGNDERIPIATDNFEDLDWMVGGGLTGLSTPVNGSFYAFKHARIYKVQRTGVLSNAYQSFLLSSTRGAVRGSVVNGVDELGRGCVYFLDPQMGPARVGSGGIQFMRGLRRTWLTVNTSADMIVAHGIYYPDKQQVHWWVATGESHSPNYKLIAQVGEVRSSDESGSTGGWVVADGVISTAWCSCIVPELINDPDTGVAILSFHPYAGFAGPSIARCDSGHLDNGDAYVARILTKPYILAGLNNRWGGMNSALLAAAVDDPSITLDIKIVRDFGVETTQISTDFVPTESESLVIKRFDHSKMSNATAIQFEFTDPPIIADNCP